MLDCDTPLGKVFINHQYQTQRILEGMGYVFLSMSKKDSHADAIIAKDIDGVLTVCGVAEIKSRRMAGDRELTRDYIREGGYLITRDKLDYGSSCSSLFGVPFYLIVNLLCEGVILVWKVTDEHGVFEFDFDTKESSTRMTCNGGEIVRRNAYLPLDKSYCIEY